MSEHNEHAAMLAQSVGDFVQHGANLPRVRALAQTRAEFDREQWRQLAEFGWLGVLVPESCGGLGLGLTEATIVAEGLGRALTPEPYTAVAVLAASLLDGLPATALRDELLTGLATGERLPLAAWQEQADDFCGTQLACRAQPFEGGFRVSGEKQFVAGAAAADGFIVSAAGAQGLALLWVPRDAAGCSVKLQPLADGRSYGMLVLKDVVVPRAQLLAEGDAARAALDRALDHAAVTAAAELVGVMKRAHEMSLDYMKTRVQFGKPIGDFQLIQLKLAKMEVARMNVQNLVFRIIELATEGKRMPLAEASACKLYCAQSAMEVALEAVQLFGGNGYMAEFQVEQLARDAKVLQIYGGTDEIQISQIARSLLAG